MEIKKKCWPEFFEAIFSGRKNFDLRLNDEDFHDVQEGDVLVLEEWNPETKNYTGRKVEKKISFVLKTKELRFWNPDETNKYGFVVMSLE